MALRFEGERTFSLPPAEVWAKLRDAQFLVQCIPGAVHQGKPERDRAQCIVTPNLTFVRGHIEVTIDVIEAEEPSSVRYTIHGKGVGSTNEVQVAMELRAHDSGTAVHWVAEVTQLSGLLKLVPSGLIRGAVQRESETVWRGIEQQLTAPP
jgi:carbon monoxide dehydrogenase subunit G